jgi:hypothetical protein
VEQIGFHPSNRDGQGPSADRCAGLLTDILKIGFDVVEADTNGVLVEQKPGTRSIAAFNERVCEGEPCLASVMMGVIAFGSLSHSHLNQILKNIKAAVCGPKSPCGQFYNYLGRYDNYTSNPNGYFAFPLQNKQ